MTESNLVGMAVAAIVAAFLYIRRFLSSDKMAIAKNSAEVDIIRSLTDQRNDATARMVAAEDAARAALIETENLAAKVRELSAANQALQTEIRLLRTLIARMTTALDSSRAQLRDIVKQMDDSNLSV